LAGASNTIGFSGTDDQKDTLPATVKSLAPEAHTNGKTTLPNIQYLIYRINLFFHSKPMLLISIASIITSRLGKPRESQALHLRRYRF